MANATEQKKPFLFQILFLAVAASLAVYFTAPTSFKIRWNDEILYFTVAKNIYFDGDFNSHHYLSESLLKKGYPTKDTHPPGFPLLIAISFLFFGVGEAAPYLLNYLLLFTTLLLVFFMGRELKGSTSGLIGAAFFLVNPLTLTLTQSMMSEISAALVVTWVFFILVMLENGFLKGLLLALGISLATLIKPFLLILLPASFLFLWLRPGEFRRRTALSLALSFALLAVFVVHPLSSNREYYPSSINDLFLQSGIEGKIQYALKNFMKNLRLTTRLGWKSGEFAILCLALGYLISPLVLTIRRKIQDWSALYGTVALAFLASLLAVYFIYEYPAWRGSRAIFAFFPVLGLLCGLSLATLKPGVAALPALGLIAINLYYAKASFDVLEQSKLRQTAILTQYSSRTDKNLGRLGLKPSVLLSTNNLQIAVERYPLRVILTEPRSLAEFAKIEALLPPDVLELSPGKSLFKENLRTQGDALSFGSNYYLAGEGGGFYYYRRR